MRKLFLAISTLIAASFIFTSCGAPAGNNVAANNTNKAANASNTATAPADNAAIEAEIKKLMDTAAAALAKNDADAMEKIYADNYMLVNTDGSVQTKAERLAALRSGDVKYSSFSYSEPNFRFNPEGTGVIVIAKASMKATNKGKTIDGDYRVTQVYRKGSDGWKQVTASAVKIEAAATPAKADEKKPAATPAKADEKKPAATPAANK